MGLVQWLVSLEEEGNLNTDAGKHPVKMEAGAGGQRLQAEEGVARCAAGQSLPGFFGDSVSGLPGLGCQASGFQDGGRLHPCWSSRFISFHFSSSACKSRSSSAPPTLTLCENPTLLGPGRLCAF